MPLVEVTAKQAVAQFEDIKGTIRRLQVSLLRQGGKRAGLPHALHNCRQKTRWSRIGLHSQRWSCRSGHHAGLCSLPPQDQSFYRADFQSTTQKDLENVEGKEFIKGGADASTTLSDRWLSGVEVPPPLERNCRTPAADFLLQSGP